MFIKCKQKILNMVLFPLENLNAKRQINAKEEKYNCIRYKFITRSLLSTQHRWTENSPDYTVIPRYFRSQLKWRSQEVRQKGRKNKPNKTLA